MPTWLRTGVTCFLAGVALAVALSVRIPLVDFALGVLTGVGILSAVVLAIIEHGGSG